MAEEDNSKNSKPIIDLNLFKKDQEKWLEMYKDEDEESDDDSSEDSESQGADLENEPELLEKEKGKEKENVECTDVAGEEMKEKIVEGNQEESSKSSGLIDIGMFKKDALAWHQMYVNQDPDDEDEESDDDNNSQDDHSDSQGYEKTDKGKGKEKEEIFSVHSSEGKEEKDSEQSEIEIKPEDKGTVSNLLNLEVFKKDALAWNQMHLDLESDEDSEEDSNQSEDEGKHQFEEVEDKDKSLDGGSHDKPGLIDVEMFKKTAISWEQTYIDEDSEEDEEEEEVEEEEIPDVIDEHVNKEQEKSEGDKSSNIVESDTPNLINVEMFKKVAIDWEQMNLDDSEEEEDSDEEEEVSNNEGNECAASQGSGQNPNLINVDLFKQTAINWEQMNLDDDSEEEEDESEEEKEEIGVPEITPEVPNLIDLGVFKQDAIKWQQMYADPDSEEDDEDEDEDEDKEDNESAAEESQNVNIDPKITPLTKGKEREIIGENESEERSKMKQEAQGVEAEESSKKIPLIDANIFGKDATKWQHMFSNLDSEEEEEETDGESNDSDLESKKHEPVQFDTLQSVENQEVEEKEEEEEEEEKNEEGVETKKDNDNQSTPLFNVDIFKRDATIWQQSLLEQDTEEDDEESVCSEEEIDREDPETDPWKPLGKNWADVVEEDMEKEAEQSSTADRPLIDLNLLSIQSKSWLADLDLEDNEDDESETDDLVEASDPLIKSEVLDLIKKAICAKYAINKLQENVERNTQNEKLKLTNFKNFFLSSKYALKWKRIVFGDDVPISDIDYDWLATVDFHLDDCCVSPKMIKQDNFNTFTRCLQQFKQLRPKLECLFNCLELSNAYLSILDMSSSYTIDAVGFMKSYLKFRHNMFSYLFTTQVIKHDDLFDNEQVLTIADSNRTPDLVIINSKHISIFEFTVVTSKLRANFLKGFNNQNSKYSKEIDNLVNKGYEVVYQPVSFSLTDTVENNISMWESQGFEINEVFKANCYKYYAHIKHEYFYLYSIAFKQETNRSHVQALNYLSKIDFYEDNWRFVFVKADKRNIHHFFRFIRDFNYIDNEFYFVKKNRLNKFTIMLSNSKNTNAITGHYLKTILCDDLLLYKQFKKVLIGRDQVLLRTRELADEISIVPQHGKLIEDVIKDSPITYKNKRNQNLITMERSMKIDKILMENTINGLNQENVQTDVKNAIDQYKLKLNKYYDTQIMHSMVQIAPRRSFLCFVDTSLFIDINFSQGIVLTSLNPADINSNLAKSILSRRHRYNYSDINSDHEGSLELKESYRNACKAFYSFIKNDKNRKLRLIRAEISDKDKFDQLKKAMINSQRAYNNSIDQTTKNKGIRLSFEELSLFKQETDWSSNRGYKLYKGPINNIMDLFDILKQPTKNIHFNLKTPSNDFEVEFIKTLKDYCINEFNEHSSELLHTTAFNNAVFMSRLAYTLMSISNQSFNSKYIKLDNLGLTDCVLIVKGGKKITSTRKTKIFKLIYPTFNDLRVWNPSLFLSNNNAFDETPWMQLHQNVLFDMLSAPYKLLANYLFLRETHDATQSFEIMSLPTLLMMHNRRKTEIILHNMRYLCVNPLAEYTRLPEMIAEFDAPTYSAFDHAIIRGLGENYLEFFKKIKEWSKLQSNDIETFQQVNIKHPFLNRTLISIVDYTFIIYSTYMMSKGHYEQSLEQTINYKKVMETHETYMSIDRSHEYDVSSDQEIDLLKKDEFGFSPEVCYNVGKILSAQIKEKKAVSQLSIKWLNILNEPIDSMANNRGLRYKGKDFFGHKGYFVIYKELYKKDWSKIEEIIEKSSDDSKLHQKLKDLNVTFESEQSETPLEQVIMHIVDKSQRGGGREIYVMDYNTKLYQNPIESMFKVLCGLIENEIISVPSARRAGLIHKKCFEYRSSKYKTYYLTLDCRKWAPKSNPDKYLYMILGMQDTLPEDFVLTVIDYFIKHTDKNIHTRKEIIDKFLSNPDNKTKYSKYLKNDEEKGSVYFKMPYSFVMGIFNMLSSLLHAGGQIYAKHLIEKEYLEDQTPIDFDMFAHSDDSGGRISISEDKFVKTKFEKNLGNYEFMMRCMNHMMSLKKCSIGENYFELISILYLNHELLPLLPKFLGNINMVFSGKGLSSDFKQVVSKSIELQSNGATNSQAYKVQILLSNMYRNFYRVVSDTQIPALGGFVNSWPIFYSTYGSQVDEVRSCMYNPDLYQRIMSFAKRNLDFDIQDGTLNLKYQNILRMPNAYNSFKKLIKLPEFEGNQWFFEQNKTRHSLLNLYWFRAKLDSSDFSTSLLNINEIKRAFDSLYMAKGKHISGIGTTFNIEELLTGIFQADKEVTEFEKILRTMYGGYIRFYSFLETLNKPIIHKKQQLTTKPCTINIQNFSEAPIQDYNSLHLAVQLRKKELMKYTFTNKRYGSELKAMEKFLFDLGVPEDLVLTKNFLDHLQKVNNATVNFYSSMPSEQRHLSSYNGILTLIKENFHAVCSLTKTIPNYIENQSHLFTQNDTLKMCILLYYFYIIYSKTKNDDIANIPITKKLTDGKSVFLTATPDIVAKKIPYPEVLPFLQMNESLESKNVVLKNMTSWAIWRNRQGKLGNDWLGYGDLDISLDNKIFRLKVLNQTVIEMHHKEVTTHVFSEGAQYYFNAIMKEFNLNYLMPIVPEEGKSYFSINTNGVLGLHKGHEATLGLQITEHNTTLDFGIYDTMLIHNYMYGKHYINISKTNYRLNTLDEIVFNESKVDLFDIVEWDSVDEKGRNYFFGILASGDFGSLPNIEYDKEELIDKFMHTDLYRFFYKQKQRNTSMSKAIWDNILTNLNYDEDIFPTMFENLGLDQLQSILPKSRKDNLSLYLYYEKENKDLRTVRYQMNKLKTEEERIKFISSLILTLDDQAGLITLPEIGDPEEFNKYKYDKLPVTYWINSIDIIIRALHSGYMYLSDISKKDLLNRLNFSPKNEENLGYLFHNRYLNNYSDYQMESYVGLTHNSLCFHELLSLIHSEKQSFAEFARTFRGTILRTLPRHPYYENNWHYLLAESYKFLHCTNLDPTVIDYFPSHLTRMNRLDKLETGNHLVYTKTKETWNKTPLIPPSFKFNMKCNYFPKKHRMMDILESDLMKIDTRKSEQLKQKNNLIDYIEEILEEKMHLKQKNKSNKIIVCKNLPDLISWANSDLSTKNIAIATDHYYENMNCYELDFWTSRGDKQTFYVYNLDNKDLQLKRPFEMINKYNDYISFYTGEIDQRLPFSKELDQKTVHIDFDTTPLLMKVEKEYNIENQDSYGPELYQYLIDNFNIKEDKDIVQLKQIFESNKSAIVKFQNIKRLINFIKKREDEEDIDLKKIVSKVLDSQMKIGSIDITQGNKIKYHINKTTRNPDKIIEKSTNYKKEFKQGSCLLKNKWGKLLTEILVLKESDKKHLTANFKLIRSNLRFNKLHHQAAVCNVVLDILNDAKTGTPSTDGHLFAEDMRILITELTKELINEEEEDVIYEEPMTALDDWKFLLDKKR
jgi:hypothetical protein